MSKESPPEQTSQSQNSGERHYITLLKPHSAEEHRLAKDPSSNQD